LDWQLVQIDDDEVEYQPATHVPVAALIPALAQ